MRKPYVILIGSASGIGKSTIAAELAKQLNIKHLIESDFIRAVVRGIIGKEYAPALHNSSYEAYKSLRNKSKYDNYDDWNRNWCNNNSDNINGNRPYELRYRAGKPAPGGCRKYTL